MEVTILSGVQDPGERHLGVVSALHPVFLEWGMRKGPGVSVMDLAFSLVGIQQVVESSSQPI